MPEATGKVVTLNLLDAHKLIHTIRLRQDDCKRITSVDAPQAELYRQVDIELEALKMKIVRQLA